MSRYTTAENLFGYYEERPNNKLRFCVIDSKPDKVSTYWARDREHILVDAPAGHPMRQIAFCMHREDAEALAKAMNLLERIK